jgi:hypothetical protein
LSSEIGQQQLTMFQRCPPQFPSTIPELLRR